MMQAHSAKCQSSKRQLTKKVKTYVNGATMCFSVRFDCVGVLAPSAIIAIFVILLMQSNIPTITPSLKNYQFYSSLSFETFKTAVQQTNR